MNRAVFARTTRYNACGYKDSGDQVASFNKFINMAITYCQVILFVNLSVSSHKKASFLCALTKSIFLRHNEAIIISKKTPFFSKTCFVQAFLLKDIFGAFAKNEKLSCLYQNFTSFPNENALGH